MLEELIGPQNDKSPIRGDRAFVASAESGAKAGGAMAFALWLLVIAPNWVLISTRAFELLRSPNRRALRSP